MSWDYEKEIERLTVELNTYRFESGAGRARIRQEVAKDCAELCRLHGAKATAAAIRERYGLTKAGR